MAAVPRQNASKPKRGHFHVNPYPPPERSGLEVSVYQNAEKLLWHNRRKLVHGGHVKPQWIDKGTRFWYRVEGPDTHEFVLVDPVARTREPAFDHKRLATALRSASGESVRATALPFTAIDVREGVVEFDTAEGHWRCALDTYTCERVEDYAPSDPLAVLSPDGTYAVESRDHNLWLRSTATGEERPLTVDGEADYAYGQTPDCLNFGTLMRTFGLPSLPPNVRWSPDSRRIITHRTDQRGVPLAWLVESTPPGGGRPVLHAYHYPLPGDETMATAELVVFDLETGTTVPAKTDPLLMPMMSPITMQHVWWAPDSSAVYYLDKPRDLRALQLNRLDPVTGEVRLMVEEQGATRVEPSQFMGHPPMVRVLSSGREVVWYSQRDGWGHLYLYDAESGALQGQVTSGDWAVQKILHVDETERVVYFVAAGLVADDPYRRQVCRAGLDGSGFARMTDDDLDHAVTVPENEAYMVDSASTTGTPPVTTVRAWDGRVLVVLEKADITGLLETGWTPPERFTVKAADGVTDIYGVLYRPPRFDPSGRYPVIDHPYPGPQRNRVEPTFDPGSYGSMGEVVAALGFVVVAVDGRGTPGRSKAFHDLSYGRLDAAGFLEDHVAALHQLAETRPWMDLDRVGIFGMSGGGYATVRAMCTYPDLYKVGVAECGNHDQRIYHLAWGETYDGPLDEERYARSSNTDIGDRLQGKLLLIHGEMDDNVHPHHTMRLVDRLIAENKDFDLLIVPGGEHAAAAHGHYITRRRWDFLVRHLLDVEPPAGFRLAEIPLDFRDFADAWG